MYISDIDASTWAKIRPCLVFVSRTLTSSISIDIKSLSNFCLIFSILKKNYTSQNCTIRIYGNVHDALPLPQARLLYMQALAYSVSTIEGVNLMISGLTGGRILAHPKRKDNLPTSIKSNFQYFYAQLRSKHRIL